MSNRNEQQNIEKIRSLIKQLEVTNRRFVRELRKLNRRLDSGEVNTTMMAKDRVVNKGKGLRGTNLQRGKH